MSGQTFTFHAGKKLWLDEADDRFVARAPREQLEAAHLDVVRQLSTASYCVRSVPEELQERVEIARMFGPAYPYYTVSGTGASYLPSDRVFVRFRPTITPAAQEAFPARFDATVLDHFDGDHEVLLQLPPAADPVAVIQDMSADQNVEIAEHDLNHLVRTSEFILPTTQRFGEEWHLHNGVNDPLFDRRSCLDCDVAWRTLSGFGDAKVVVGITDGGCDLTLPELQPAAVKFAGWGFFEDIRLFTNENGADAGRMPDPSGHGTAMAALIAATDKGPSAVGVAPACSLLPIRFENDGLGHLFVCTSRVRRAFRHLSPRVDVISNSWVTGHYSLWGKMFCDEIRRLADQGGRRGNGVVFIWAAGNSNCPIADEFRASVDVPVDSGRDNSGAFVGPRTARVFKNELVGLPSVVHVGAVASTARRSHYSNYGAGLSLSAPSDNRNLYSCGKAPGLQLRCDPSNQPGGTSASAAIVAGTAALVVSAYPALTARQVISILQSTATRDLDLTPYPRSQFPDCGTGDFDVSPVPPFDDGAFKDVGRPDGTRSPWFGFGCVNGGRAVAEAALRRQASIAEKSAESAAV